MKSSVLKISLILGILTLVLPGCLDIWITTQIRPDGSIEQTIAFQGDSAEIADVQFAFMKEKDWKREWTKPEKDKYKLQISKEFKSVKELNESMNPADTNLLTVRVNASLQRKFRWFFTRYEYTETARKSNPFPSLDYHKYLSDEEVRLISLTEEARKTDPKFDSVNYKTTEKRFEDFLYHSMFESFYQKLIKVVTEDKSFTLSRNEIESKKEVFYHFVLDSVKGDSTSEMLIALGKIIRHPDIQVIQSKYLHSFDGFQKALKFYEAASDDNYKFAISMPGLLLQTNSPKIEGSTLGWDLTYYDFFFKDYTMTAESRMVNTWAFIVAGILILVALASLFVAMRKKRGA